MKPPIWASLISFFLIAAAINPVNAKTINGCPIKPYTHCLNANLAGADLRKANLAGADLRGANLVGANLKGATLTGALLKQANLSGAILTAAKIKGAGLQFTLFIGSTLVRAELQSSDLFHANLSGADLRQANLFAANLTGANLTGANTTGANFSQVTYNGSNQIPDDLGPTISVGSKGPAGGIVFYVAPDGHHGLEGALASQIANTWGCATTSVPKTLVAVGTGAFNTKQILEACPDAGTAAQIASVYAQNGYADWYLPSKEEMAMAMPFVDQFNLSYWTSSQATPTSAWGWYWNSFATGTGPNQLTYSQSFQTSKTGVPAIAGPPSPVTGVYPIRSF